MSNLRRTCAMPVRSGSAIRATATGARYLRSSCGVETSTGFARHLVVCARSAVLRRPPWRARSGGPCARLPAAAAPRRPSRAGRSGVSGPGRWWCGVYAFALCGSRVRVCWLPLSAQVRGGPVPCSKQRSCAPSGVTGRGAVLCVGDAWCAGGVMGVGPTIQGLSRCRGRAEHTLLRPAWSWSWRGAAVCAGVWFANRGGFESLCGAGVRGAFRLVVLAVGTAVGVRPCGRPIPPGFAGPR